MKISVVLHHVHRGQLPHVSPGSWKTEVLHICVQYWQYSSSSFFCELFCYKRRGKGEAFYLAWMDSLVAFKAARAVCELLYHCVRRCIGKSFLNTPTGLKLFSNVCMSQNCSY